MKVGRRALRMWHRWFGLAAGLWLLLLAITGSAITYYEELDHALNGDLRRIAEAQAPVPAPVATALARAEGLLPGFQARHIDLPDQADETIWLIGSAMVDGDRTGVQVFAHPQSGEVVGWRRSGVLSLDRRHLPDLLYGLHV
ncbi:MAG: PepSY domain-containing protein, partial [Alphaproteobacteria bacterium]|nr:PepSY domain-containing protein [Alphaproteobacteria bacterium]